VKGNPQNQLPLIQGARSLPDGILVLELAKLPELEELGGAVRIDGEVLQDPISVILGDDEN
jgi:hypothetical protein